MKKPSREAEYRPAVPALAEGAEDSQALELRPLVVDTLGVARLLGLSERTVRALNASGRLPRPLALGGRRLWSRRELEEWVDAGTPGRDRWEAHGRGSLGKRTHGRG